MHITETRDGLPALNGDEDNDVNYNVIRYMMLHHHNRTCDMAKCRMCLYLHVSMFSV